MIKIFIGTEPKTELARKVLEYSILKNTNSQVQFNPMLGEDWVVRPNQYVGTGFSLLRWSIPERCNNEGFAIYLDADIIALGDIKELWECDVTYPNNGCSVWCTYRTDGVRSISTPESSVMLIDCAKAKGNQPSYQNCVDYLENDPNPGSRSRYKKIMWCLKHQCPPQVIPSRFNRLNDPSPVENAVLLHYTIERKQPWYNPNHPFASLWEELLKESLGEGYVQKDEVQNYLDKYRPFEAGKRGYGLHPYWKKVLL